MTAHRSEAERREPARLRQGPRAGAAIAVACALLGCEPRLIVGEWMCSANGTDVVIPPETAPVAVPWSTGFESRFCDYTQLAGFCLAGSAASFTTVDSPVHSGRYAAAYRVRSDDEEGHQARCVRQGALPTDAYYGAWFLVPRAATNDAVWNLVHFQGGTPTEQHGLWDISLVNTQDGDLETVVYSFLSGVVYRPETPAPIPINEWFHLEFHLKRATDASGEVALYQDGQLVVEAKNVITDDSDWGQWYLGNYATGLTPSDFTLYVDDVTIRGTR